MTEKVSQIVDRGREAYDRARSNVAGTPAASGNSGNTGSTGTMTGAGVGTGGGYTSNRS